MECKLHKDKSFKNFKLKQALKRNFMYLTHSKHSWRYGSNTAPLIQTYQPPWNIISTGLQLVHMHCAMILGSKTRETGVKVKTESTNGKVSSVALYMLLGKNLWNKLRRGLWNGLFLIQKFMGLNIIKPCISIKRKMPIYLSCYH